MARGHNPNFETDLILFCREVPNHVKTDCYASGSATVGHSDISQCKPFSFDCSLRPLLGIGLYVFVASSQFLHELVSVAAKIPTLQRQPTAAGSPSCPCDLTGTSWWFVRTVHPRLPLCVTFNSLAPRAPPPPIGPFARRFAPGHVDANDDGQLSSSEHGMATSCGVRPSGRCL